MPKCFRICSLRNCITCTYQDNSTTAATITDDIESHIANGEKWFCCSDGSGCLTAASIVAIHEVTCQDSGETPRGTDFVPTDFVPTFVPTDFVPAVVLYRNPVDEFRKTLEDIPAMIALFEKHGLYPPKDPLSGETR